MIQTLIAAALAAVVRTLFGRWLPQPKDDTHAALDATKAEAKAYAAPARNKSRTVGVFRQHQPPEG